ncbi:MAG: thioredoxin [Puniceicoccales bacterium]|jgi:thioredoxin 1|nr:thioredoxin [Puniceicoccales bacterium]
MASDRILHINEASYDAFIQSAAASIAVVDFWAPWCGPCKAIGPVLDQIADELGDAVKIAKVNVDDNRELAQKLEVQSIPTLLFFKDGAVVNRIVGSRSKADYIAAIQKVQG